MNNETSVLVPIFFPLHVCVGWEKWDCRQIDELQFKERIVKDQRGEEL